MSGVGPCDQGVSDLCRQKTAVSVGKPVASARDGSAV